MDRKHKQEVLYGLTAQEGQAVLRLLLKRHPALIEEAESLAVEVASSVDRDAVADDVVAAVDLLSLEDLSGRAGRQSWGYVEPGEAAWELLEEAIKGYQNDIARLAGLGLEDGARATCEGVLLGLYRLRDAKDHDVLAYAEDFSVETFAWILEQWLKAKGPQQGRRAVDEAFIDQMLPDWGELVDQVVERLT